jgi:hypothetical protein
MIILLTAVAVLIMGVPLAAVTLVTLASRREERARSIAGLAPGNLTGAARRLLGFRATNIARPACRKVPANRRNRARLARARMGEPDALDGADAAMGPANALEPTGGPALAGGSVGLR